MLEIDMVPVRGVLFVRLRGKLDRQSTDKLNREVIKFLKRVGIKNIVFNINALDYIDKYGELALINSFKVCKNNNGQSFICVSKNQKLLSKLSHLLEKVGTVNDELAAVNLINS